MASTLGTHNPLRYRGYVYDTENGLYYLQSRYYNPQVGRFLNADAFAATGQGLLGNNMLAYCHNNPIAFSDDSGQLPQPSQFSYTSDKDAVGRIVVAGAIAGVAVGASIILGPIIEDSFVAVGDAIADACKEVYEFSQAVKAELAQSKRKFPHVHHIVPVGSFSSRSVSTQAKISEMHRILAEANINRWIDPFNLMLVSAGVHASLHTDAYIDHVYSYIKPAEGDRVAIYSALFSLRIEIAARDVLASGY